MKNAISYLSIVIATLTYACTSTRFPADNEAKEDYLERKKDKSNDPTNDEDKYDEKSGKGGGVNRRAD